jgi:hypothetical protein
MAAAVAGPPTAALDPTSTARKHGRTLHAVLVGGSNGNVAWRGQVTIVQLKDPRHTISDSSTRNLGLLLSKYSVPRDSAPTHVGSLSRPRPTTRHTARCTASQGLALFHFSAQPEPFLTQNTAYISPYTP